MLGSFFSFRVVPMILLLFESQKCVLFPLISDWFCRLSGFYLFGFSVLLNFVFWCSLFSWFYNFVVPKFFSRNVLIVVLTSFVFCCQYKRMLYNIILDIFLVHHTDLRLVTINNGNTHNNFMYKPGGWNYYFCLSLEFIVEIYCIIV